MSSPALGTQCSRMSLVISADAPAAYPAMRTADRRSPTCPDSHEALGVPQLVAQVTVPLAHNLRGHTSRNGEGGHVFGDDGTGRYDGPFADRHARQSRIPSRSGPTARGYHTVTVA